MPTYKDKKTGKWRTLIYYKDYRGEPHIKQKRGFKTQREAKEFERDFLSKFTKDITLKQAKEEYFDYISTRLRESTVRNKRWYAKNLEYIEHINLLNISPKAILDWQKHMQDIGKSNKTINQSTEVLYGIFKHNCKMYSNTHNPVKAIEKLPTEKKEMDYWTLDEFNTFLGFVEDPEKSLAFKILFYGGIRYGELLGLQIGDIYDTYIDINKSYDYRSKKFCPTKNKQSVRQVVMPDKIMDDIRAYISTLYKPGKKDRLFSKTTNTWLSRQLKVTCEKYNLHKIRVHDLRHSHATLLINNGIDVLIISHRLGHSNPTTTLNTYSHLYKNRSTEAVDLLNKLANL
ncbi:site-specific integrase [Peptostreptococcus anaerobius]|uniref:site-specific integrase n=1 Tax=Peptostreptococcus anaerobius TaxID=1261 RepID=UPI00242D5461|nr:site-specific integrase [Peptostreptococcus anaerobius]